MSPHAWAHGQGCCGHQVFCQTLSRLRCCKLLTTSANEHRHIIKKSIFNAECNRKRAKKVPHLTDFTDILEKKTLSICRVGTLGACSLLRPSCVPVLALVSPGNGDGNLCAGLWQYKWMPGKGFCQDLAGASSCFTVAVKHISATSGCSPVGKDWIEVCVFFFFFYFFFLCTGVVIFFLGFWALIWNMKLPDPKDHCRVGEIHNLAMNNIFPPLVMEESPDHNHSAAGNFQMSFLCVFSGIWTSLENVNLQQMITKWGLAPWPSLGKLSVGTSCHLWWATVAKELLCGTHTRCRAPGCTQGMCCVVQCHSSVPQIRIYFCLTADPS